MPNEGGCPDCVTSTGLKLDIEIKFHSKAEYYSIVRNLPGLDAEMNEHDLRSIADQLIAAADKLSQLNK